MKLNFGHKLLITFLVFGGIMFSLVYGSMSTTFELVSKDYYKDELAFQQVIDARANAKTLEIPPGVTLKGDSVIVHFPASLAGNIEEGKVSFYCPSEAAKDKTFQLVIDASGNQAFLAGKDIAAGRYTIKLSWKSNGKNFLHESSLLVP
jgi:nitrogen fixation protein FixH